SDDEWDNLFDTSQHVNDSDSKQDFDNIQGSNNDQVSNNKQGFGNEKNSDDEWDSDSLNEWKFDEQIILNTKEIPENTKEIGKPRLTKLGKSNAEIVAKVKYRLEFEEYPETSDNRVACIYNVAGMDPEKALEIFDLKNIQYSYKEGTARKSVYCPFLKIKVYKKTQACRSIKICQFAASELVTMIHTSVNFDDNLFKKIFDANELSLDTNTLNAFAVAHKTSCGFIHSHTRIRCDGKPKLEKHYQHEDDTSEPTYFIGCEKFRNGEHGHQYQSLSEQINIRYLKRLFQEHTYYIDGIIGEVSNLVRYCYLVYPFSARAKKCSAIQNDLKSIIEEENILDLTARRLIT
ncbi:17924_t:CDS:2, partial [Racocetra persica]